MAASVLLAPGLGSAETGPAIHFPAAPRERIAVSAYPFRDFLVGWKGWDGKTPSSVPASQQIALKDFAAHAGERFNIYKVELWGRVFPSTDMKYLDELRGAIAKAGSVVVDIGVDEGHSQYAADPVEREHAVTASRRWIDAGAALNSPSIRTHINGAKDSKPDVGRAADTLTRVAEYAEKKNVVVHLENDNPVSEDPFFIASIIDKVNSPWLRALPDFGNSVAARDEDYAYRGIDAMFAHAYGICHVKAGGVNPQEKVVPVDLARTFGILKKHGYKGFCSMEYDQPGDPYQATADLIEKTMGYLS
jgi:sugar phosphate isomerase/epimerase